MSVIEDDGSAFPFAANDRSNMDMQSAGMTRRDWLAGQAATGIAQQIAHLCATDSSATNASIDTAIEASGALAYRIADAVLKAGNAIVENPLQRELNAAKAQIDDLESLRPFWAKGFSSDSIAAQTTTVALSSLWKLLGVTNQTMAVMRLKELVAREPLV